ncbi:MAG: hypothetical protein Q9166_003496 [cf. Caloplaca sp. 2 TL-2023]
MAILQPFLIIIGLVLPSFTVLTTAQQAGTAAFAIFNDTGRLPNRCVDGYEGAHDEVLYTVPYTYDQILSVIGSFANITWNGDNSTTLNGTDNTVGTARTYEYYGIRLIETIKTYSKPVNGPYFEDHTIAPAYNPATNLSLYAPVDSLTATPICGNTAVALNFTVDFCATNVTAASEIFHSLHLQDAVILQEFLGNESFTGCWDYYTSGAYAYPSSTGTGALPSGTSTAENGTSIGGGYASGPTMTPMPYTGGTATPCLNFGAIATAIIALLL